MHPEWSFPLGGQQVTVVRSADAGEIHRHFAIPGETAARHVDAWFPDWHRDSGSTRYRLIGFARALQIHFGAPANHIETAILKERVQDAFRQGRLLAAPSRIRGGFDRLQPFTMDNLITAPRRRGIYILYAFDAPFFAGRCLKDTREVLERQLGDKGNREIGAVDGRSVQFDYYCPQSDLETESDIVLKLDPDRFGGLRLHPDATAAPLACREKGCTCRAYDDAVSKGMPLIRGLQTGRAKCRCGHGYAQHQ
jgi:hypothetical protein